MAKMYRLFSEIGALKVLCAAFKFHIQVRALGLQISEIDGK